MAVVCSPNPQFLEILTVYGSPVGDIAIALRAIVLEEAPNVVEKFYRNHPSAIWFGSGQRMRDMFLQIATTRSHVNLGFCRGATLPDPDHVLDGVGKVMRHVKFWSEADVARPLVRKYIRAAARQDQRNAGP